MKRLAFALAAVVLLAALAVIAPRSDTEAQQDIAPLQTTVAGLAAMIAQQRAQISGLTSTQNRQATQMADLTDRVATLEAEQPGSAAVVDPCVGVHEWAVASRDHLVRTGDILDDVASMSGGGLPSAREIDRLIGFSGELQDVAAQQAILIVPVAGREVNELMIRSFEVYSLSLALSVVGISTLNVDTIEMASELADEANALLVQANDALSQVSLSCTGQLSPRTKTPTAQPTVAPGVY